MRSSERPAQPDAQLEHGLPRHGPRQQVQRAPLNILGDDVRVALDVADPVDAGNVRMLDAGRGARFIQDLLAHLGIGLQCANELDGNRAI